MLKVSQMEKVTVYRPKKGVEGDLEKLNKSQLSSIGKIHLTVCSPSGKRVVGFLIRRPDIAGMIKQKDVFIALDSFVVCDYGLVASKGDASFDDAARERMHLPWEKCIIWAGMDAKTTNGRELGWVADFSFDAKSGRILTFFVGDGGVASSLVGYIEIPGSMLRGYENGFMLVDPEASKLALDGGLAAKAGEGYAKAKIEGKAAGKKVAKVAGSAVEKGAYGLGRLIGKAKRSIEEYQNEDEESESLESPEITEVESISEPANKGLLDEAERDATNEVEDTVTQVDTPVYVAASEVDGVVEESDAATAEGVSAESVGATHEDNSGKTCDNQGEDSASAERPNTGSTMRTYVPASELNNERQQAGDDQDAAKSHDAGTKVGVGEPDQNTDATADTRKHDVKGTDKPKAEGQTQPKPKPKQKTKAKAKPQSKTKTNSKQRTAGDEAARAFGRGLGKMNSMFGSFVEEYKKSSK